MTLKKIAACVMLGAFTWLQPISSFAKNISLILEGMLSQNHLSTSSVGVWVQAVDEKIPLLDLNARTPFAPASTMKLVTTIAALDLLGPSFRWVTQALSLEKIKDGVLNGDLYFRGGGDPTLNLENFWLFLRQLRAAGLREIRGDIILDRSSFAAQPYEMPFDAAKFDQLPFSAYNAGPDALLLNYGTLAITFRSSTKTLGVWVDPPLAGIRVVAPHISEAPCPTDWDDQLSLVLINKALVIQGPYFAKCGTKIWRPHPYRINSDILFMATFTALWQQMGGRFSGKVRSGNVPVDVHVLSEWQSQDLVQTLHSMNKVSNNVMARQIFLTLSQIASSEPANASTSRQVIEKWLNKNQIDTAGFVIENGSGLSRLSRISPKIIGELLVKVFQSATMAELISALPIAGVDGTLRNRFLESGARAHAHLKTGSLKNARALAGYITAANGKRYVLVCLINLDNLNDETVAQSAMKFMDQLVDWVYTKEPANKN